MAILLEIMGKSSGGNVAVAPSFFHNLPTSFSDSIALLSINPSRFGATLRIKLQLASFKGLISVSTISLGLRTGTVGKSVFQNHEVLIGKQAKAGITLFSLCMRWPAPIS
ncbi:hypothetical protein D3C72_2052420 [compost metagenome]